MTLVEVDAAATATGSAPRERRRRGVPKLVWNLLSLILGIGVWWGISLAGYDVPDPPAVAKRFGELLGDGTLEKDILASLARVLAGEITDSMTVAAAFRLKLMMLEGSLPGPAPR